jgi:hypothetical protein
VSTRRTSDSTDMLVGVVTSKADRDIFMNQGWYRVPVANWPRPGWWPKWIALFETKAVTDAEQRILYYGRVHRIVERRGAELFPGVPLSGRETKLYHQVLVERPLERHSPIVLDKRRRNPFILTNRSRFEAATSVSELIVGSPLEEQLWEELRRQRIPAEREWYAYVGRRWYWLDFALFCHARNIDVEVDGDTYHLTQERARYDNQRNNELTSRG